MPNRVPLIKGYREFRQTDFNEQKQLYELLGRHGQKPGVMILSCSDSRVDPTDIFHAFPGEMFVVRNVAGMIPPRQDPDDHHGTASAVEYGVRALNVRSIVVLGHESCGGCLGALEGLGGMDTDYLGPWLELLAPAAEAVRKAAPESPERMMEEEVVKLSIRNLMTYPFVADAVERGELQLIGAWFSIISAKLTLLGEDGAFAEVAEG